MEGLSHMNKVEVLYEDNHIIVVVKPVNVLSQGDATSDLDLLTMVKNYVKEKYGPLNPSPRSSGRRSHGLCS